ncbi:hypothetical protein JCM17380_06580 [Desulfosporosinus burensis]
MKKGLVFGVISCLLVFIFITNRSDIPSEVPKSVVIIVDQNIETALGYYNWFDKDQGGNTHFGDSPENLVKELHTVIAKKGERVYFNFKTSRPPIRNTVYLIVPNEKEPLNFGMIEQPSEGNSFIVPEESGPYIFVITGYWDDSHAVDYAFKITVDKI